MTENKYSFEYQNYSKLKSPYQKDNREVYHLWVNVKQIPHGFPTEVNPRDVKTNTKVYRRIRDALTESTQSFFVNNRGILISAKNVTLDSVTKEIILDLGADDENDKYGVLDGGHTYHAIINNKLELDPEIEQFVHLEIMTNVMEIDELSGARNTSVQVSDKAIAELANKFEFVKKSIENEPYSSDIAYRENEDKRLDTVDLVRLMYAFNVFKYGGDSAHPIQAYSGKAEVLKDYLANYDDKTKGNRNDYMQIAPLLPDIIHLYEKIELEMADGYKAVNPKGAFGRIKGVDKKEKGTTTKYFQTPTSYQITQGFIFPILAAFRSLIEIKNDDTLEWIVDPLKVWEKSKGKLVNNTIEMSRQLGNNPQSTGKSNALWVQNYDAVNSEKLQIQIEMLQNK
ncbi:AIPR family protein [Salibacterium qingdaonense]|uniref:AIPR protein n=1 Tax=Salibacterium qingdaonense TaxID=266892 RepID=A0A1I4NFP1_9BACI|nr:AIPR family protein [Salibacterium qingdaonense]SFM14321.1 AIPR protein [Salibacterium qingdaonense]